MKLLFNYLPYPMKDSEPVVRSTKKASTKANTNGSGNTKITKFFSSFYSSSGSNTTSATNNSNGTSKKKAPTKSTGKDDKTIDRPSRKRKDSEINNAQEDVKPIANDTKRKKIAPSSQTSLSVVSSSSPTSSSASTLSSSSSPPTTISNGKTSSLSTPTKRKKLKKKVKKGNSKSSPTLRPRRRASQTYFFKYQLARNPLKAEEEDLKLALLASLQQCDDSTPKEQLQEQLKRQQLIYENHLQNHKQPRKGVQSNHHQPPSKQQKQKHPPPQKTVVLNNNPTPPAYDEEYLKRYRPETEDFLTFICFRISAQNYTLPQQQNELPTVPTASGSIDQLSNNNMKPLNGCTTTSTTTGIHVKINNDKLSNEYHNLRRSTSPCKSSASNQTASNSSPNHLNSPCNRRRPTRHSPRLASSSRKISEFDSLNHYTAYDNQINYEEDMKKASIALEDMAQEINGSDDNESAPNHKHSYKSANEGTTTAASITSTGTKSSLPYKNNKHLVKGLMTREFAGAFADEEIIFESIKSFPNWTIEMQAAHYCSLLPELFRHKTTKVRLPRPQAILLDFHGTISERLWEDKVIYPYVREALSSYLQNNWNDDVIQRCLPGLRNESFEQRFRNKFEDAPVISDPNEGADEIEPAQLASQMSDFLLWQMSSKKETHETLVIERSVWRDGLKRRQILTPIYDDVMPCVREWSEKYNCLIYIISSLDGETLKLLFENTNRGDLNRYVKDYVSPKKPGDKLSSELYRQFFEKLPIVKNRPSTAAEMKTNVSAAAGSTGSSVRPSSPGSHHQERCPPKGVSSPKRSPTAIFETISKPVLYLTDSGQEAKAASQVNDESAFECVLVNRPGNKRFRTYYLSQFAYIERFDDIAFVS